MCVGRGGLFVNDKATRTTTTTTAVSFFWVALFSVEQQQDADGQATQTSGVTNTFLILHISGPFAQLNRDSGTVSLLLRGMAKPIGSSQDVLISLQLPHTFRNLLRPLYSCF